MSAISRSQLLKWQDFERLAVELQGWRIEPKEYETQIAQATGLVLGFVKGLRLSAGIIYGLRKTLSAFPVEVDWGHLLSPSSDSISPECDVIIHRKGILQEWNGNVHPVMDFKFIPCDLAIAVVSCKSYLPSIDKAYCARLKPYVKNILLFAECCAPGRIKGLKAGAEQAGYLGLWHLYSFNGNTRTAENALDDWEDFVSVLEKLCRKEHERTKRQRPR